MLIFALLWWSWVCYAWLGNVVKADEGPVRAAMLTAIAVMFVIALTIPEAFTDFPTGLHGPAVLAVCYFLFRAIHLGMSGWPPATTPDFEHNCCGSRWP